MAFNYPEIPESGSSYMKLVGGENRFRILTEPIDGYVYWLVIDGKKTPIRKRIDEPIPQAEVEEAAKHAKGNALKYFWALAVWNYEVSKVQVLGLTQKSILKEIKALGNDKDWGEPTGYDIVISREGEGMETTYTVMPKPAKPLSKEATEQWNEVKKTLDLTKLFENSDPFEGEEKFTEAKDPFSPEDLDDEIQA